MTRTSQVFLLLGFASTTAAAALFCVPASALLGILLLPIGLVLAVAALVMKPSVCEKRTGLPLAVSMIGALLLPCAAISASALAQSIDNPLIFPNRIEHFGTLRDWAITLGLSLAAALALVLGLAQRAKLSRAQALWWAATVFAVPVASFGLYFAFHRFFPVID